MIKLTKKKHIQQAKYDFKHIYNLYEGIALVKESHSANFDASVDIAVRLGIDIKNPLHMVRTSVILPHGTGKVPKVLVICTPEKEQEAKDAGADHAGLDHYLKKIEEGWIAIDVIVAMPSLMAKMGRLGRVLGPAGLMPNIKTGTVTEEIGRAVKEIKLGKVAIKTDKNSGIIHSSVGRISFSPEQIKENVEEMINAIIRAKHSTVKGSLLQSVTLSSTMGSGVHIAIDSITSK